jgi:CheY-like chemotaxis protein
MSCILLADRSPHAQRMGERILREEGFEVVTVTSGETALVRVDDVEPDLLMVDVTLTDLSGYKVCGHLKADGRTRRIPVILTVGEFDPFDEEEAKRVEADGIVKKPFEASVLSSTVRKLLGQGDAKARPAATPRPALRRAPPVALIDPERVRAAVTIALDAAMPAIIEEITKRVLVALSPREQPSPTSQAQSADTHA